jgi:transposase InsO family protein
MRWADTIGEYRYIIIHIDGEQNVWADLLSRWGNPPPSTKAHRTLPEDVNYHEPELVPWEQAKPVRARLPREGGSGVQPNQRAPQKRRQVLRPLDEDGFIWPSMAEICQAQQETKVLFPRKAKRNPKGEVWIGDKLYIPEDATDLIQRMLVVAHCGSMGHRGEYVMQNHLRRNFYIEKVNELVHKFISECPMCPFVKGGKIVQRPHSELWHATKVNEGIHFDFLFLGDGYNGRMKYVLALKDDLSHFCELIACEEPTAEVTVTALVDWAKRFGMPEVWISDQGTHFKNEVLKAVAAKMRVDHKFTITYSPWRNGTIERLNRDLLQVLRALLKEYHLDEREWEYLLPVVQANLNHSPVASLRGLSPTEVFTSRAPKGPLDFIIKDVHTGKKHSGDLTTDEVVNALATVRKHMELIHKEIRDEREKKMWRGVASGNNLNNFEVQLGDYVLWSRVDDRKYPKLAVTWLGPYVVTEVRQCSCMIKHLLTNVSREAHNSRLKLYAESSFEISETMRELISEQGLYITIQEIKEIRYNQTYDGWEVYVRWTGLEEIESTWEKLQDIYHDAPVVAQKFVASIKDRKLREKVEKDMKSFKR